MKRETVVLGLGNPLMSDEGVGVRVLERLSALAERYPLVEFVDAGTGGMSLLHLLEGRGKAVIIDCARMGIEPGRIRRFTAEQARSVKRQAHMSLHEADILNIIDLSRELDQCPDEIVIFGIQPKSIRPGQELSRELADRMDDYIDSVCEELDG
ncbi:MAG: HyaD/HybD family hydrogenase maturation endopeptidase [Phycisphaerales bacterium]|nr:MAG: HyaD/HybD family hydrogenase maturation endopeptidase [Phycisphaerales bacterium]